MWFKVSNVTNDTLKQISTLMQEFVWPVYPFGATILPWDIKDTMMFSFVVTS